MQINGKYFNFSFTLKKTKFSYPNNMANGIYKITEDFEKSLSDYTGAPYVITVDNQSNALFLALYYEKNIKISTFFWPQSRFYFYYSYRKSR